MVRLLLESGADASITNADGKTAPQCATEAGRDDVADLIAQYDDE